MFIAEANNPERSMISGRTISSVFHKCQRRFGVCIGRLVDYDVLNPVWRFARCSGKHHNCATQITDVTVYWEGK